MGGILDDVVDDNVVRAVELARFSRHQALALSKAIASAGLSSWYCTDIGIRVDDYTFAEVRQINVLQLGNAVVEKKR